MTFVYLISRLWRLICNSQPSLVLRSNDQIEESWTPVFMEKMVAVLVEGKPNLAG